MARICVIRQGFFPLDPRVHREVETLRTSGYEVDIICMRRPGEPRVDRGDGLVVRRIAVDQSKGGVAGYILRYLGFFAVAMVLSSVLHLRRRYSLVQVNSMPDALVFAAVVPRFLGARVLLDLHECMPEFYATKFAISDRHPVVRGIAWFEQAAIRFADLAITCSEQMREVFISRGAPPSKVGVVLNGSDETVFDPARYPAHRRKQDRFTLVSHGTVEERYGLDTIVRAVALLKEEIPGLRLHIYGNGSYLGELRRLAAELGVEREVYFSGDFVPLDSLVRAIAESDVGVVAMKRDAFRDLTLCNKMYDFIAMRKPAIVSRTRSVEAYFDESCFLMFESGNAHDLARQIVRVYADEEIGDEMARRAQEVNAPYRWRYQQEIYREFVERLVEEGRDSARRNGAQVAARGMNKAEALPIPTVANPGRDRLPREEAARVCMLGRWGHGFQR